MNFIRKHWFDLGGVLAILVLLFIFINGTATPLHLIMWLSLVSLFFHQLEEYRIVGTFPGLINKCIFHSDQPDRYPLNTNTSLIINVFIGWATYFLAAIFAERALWLCIATLMVSLGNIIAHTVVFNIKGKRFYNAGLVTSWLCFAPCIYFFLRVVIQNNLSTTSDILIGIILGICFNVFGVFKLIHWLADRNTTYIFDQRNLLPEDRNVEG